MQYLKTHFILWSVISYTRGTIIIGNDGKIVIFNVIWHRLFLTICFYYATTNELENSWQLSKQKEKLGRGKIYQMAPISRLAILELKKTLFQFGMRVMMGKKAGWNEEAVRLLWIIYSKRNSFYLQHLIGKY